MSSLSLFADSSRVIAAQFDLADLPAGSASEEERERAFRAMLIDRIIELLSGNTERLMHILYRVDVSEAAVAEIFRDTPLPEIAPALADRIIERQMEKARTRAEYREGKDEGN